MRVNSRNYLWDHGEPSVDVYVSKPSDQGRFDFGRATVIEPKCEQA